MKKKLKKQKFILLCATVGLCFSLNSNVYAEEAINSSSLTSETGIKIASSQETQKVIPAVEKTLPTEVIVDEKNIVPVLDLKGGVAQQETKQEKPLEIWLNSDRMTGDWGGLRSNLEDKGITLSSSYMMNNYTKVKKGGLLRNSKASYQGIINTSAELDLQKLHLVPGGKAFVLFQNIHGQGLTDKYVGDYMYFNGYESTRPGPQLSEYWYEQSLLSDKIKIKVGKQDGNSEFQALDTGFNFVHSGFNFIVNSALPTYPNPSMALVATIQPTENMYVKYGLFDGEGVGSQSGFNTMFHKDGSLMNIEELGLTHNRNNQPGKLIFGLWQRNRNTEELLFQDQIDAGYEPMVYKGTNGLYTEFEQMLFKEKRDDAEDTQGLSLMGQFAWSPAKYNELTKYFGVAAVYKGIAPYRPDDALGVGMNFASFSNRTHATMGTTKGENVLEVFYKIALTPWLYLQPDFQYINKPYYANHPTAMFGLRTCFEF